MLSGSLPPRTRRTWGPGAVEYLALWDSKSQGAFCFWGRCVHQQLFSCITWKGKSPGRRLGDHWAPALDVCHGTTSRQEDFPYAGSWRNCGTGQLLWHKEVFVRALPQTDQALFEESAKGRYQKALTR